MARRSRYSPEVRDRAIRMVREHGAEHQSQWAAIASIAGKLGCTAETLRETHEASGPPLVCDIMRRVDAMLTVRILPAAALLFGSCAMWPLVGEAGQIDYKTARLERTLPAVRADGPIRIDGALDEPDWAGAPTAHGFIQSDPREGEPATEDTDVRVLYDADSLYFGVFAHDREPYNILTSELAKDLSRWRGRSRACKGSGPATTSA